LGILLERRVKQGFPLHKTQKAFVGSASLPHPTSAFFLFHLTMQKLTILFEGTIEINNGLDMVAEQINVTVDNCKNIHDALRAYASFTNIEKFDVPKVVDVKYGRSM
jgi:hypothetical protein